MGDFFANVGKAFLEAGGKIGDAVIPPEAREYVANAAKSHCYLENDTKYKVKVHRYDGTFILNPGKTQYTWLVKAGLNLYLDLYMIFDNGKEEKISFPEDQFQDRTHKMSIIFADAIKQHGN